MVQTKSTAAIAMFDLLRSKPEAQSAKDFCLQNNLDEGKYYYWRKKILDNTEQRKPEGFVALKIKNTSSDNGRPLAALELPTGSRLVIYDPCIMTMLKDLL